MGRPKGTGTKLSEQTKLRQKEARQRYWDNKERSNAHREMLRQNGRNAKNRVVTEDAKERMSESAKKRWAKISKEKRTKLHGKISYTKIQNELAMETCEYKALLN